MAKFYTMVTVVIEVEAPTRKVAHDAILCAKNDLREAMPESVGPWGITSHGVLNEGQYDPLGSIAA